MTGSSLGREEVAVRRDFEEIDQLRRVKTDAHQPAIPVGILVDLLGSSTTFEFTATISPEIGAMTSLTALTDSRTSP